MEDEARFRWNRFIGEPENEPYFEEYPWASKDPTALFHAIGEDLGSSQRETRERGFWALVLAMPELADILHERESRQPRWRERLGKDQRMVNEALWKANDVVTYLQGVLVYDAKFKIGGRHGKDPRPYTRKAIGRWRGDALERKAREVSLDEPIDSSEDGETSLADLVSDPNILVEEEAIDTLSLEDICVEAKAWGFMESEVPVFKSVYVDDKPLAEVSELFEIPSVPALRQILSRKRRQAVTRRDELLSLALFHFACSKHGRVPELFRQTRWFEHSSALFRSGPWTVFPVGGGWITNHVKIDSWAAAPFGPGTIIRPLTSGVGGIPGEIYQIAMPQDITEPVLAGFCIQAENGPRRVVLLRRRSTELPTLDKLVNELPSNYLTWLLTAPFDLHHLRPVLARQIRANQPTIDDYL